MTRLNGTIIQPISDLPFNSKVINFYNSSLNKNDKDSENDAAKMHNGVSFAYEGFFTAIQEKTQSLNERSFNCLLRNPDFNILSANGITPITPAQGSDYEMVSNWYVSNNDLLNNYTITPVNYSSIPPFGTGSNYYLNVSIPTLASPFYFYNKNYSTTGQFISSSQTNGQTVACSSIIKNNTNVRQKVRFSAFLNGSGDTVSGDGVFLEPDSYNLISTNIEIPDIKGTTSGASAYTQFRLNFENNYGAAMDMDIFYLKTEISNLSTPLQLNHILEQLICSNLT